MQPARSTVVSSFCDRDTVRFRELALVRLPPCVLPNPSQHRRIQYRVFPTTSDLECTQMEQRRLGRTGPQVSAVGLGCMSIGIADVYSSSIRDDGKAVELIHRALDLGSTFLDTANIYGDSEAKIGKALVGRHDS